VQAADRARALLDGDSLDEAQQAELQLRGRLADAQRLGDYQAAVKQARADSHVTFGNTASGHAASGNTGAGQVIVHGSWVCPVQGPVSFRDDFGEPRSGGRGHKGNDMFAARGTPVVAVTNGSVFFQGDRLGGNAAYLNGVDANTYYFAHLDDYVGGARAVKAGEVIGHVGNTGDASDGPTHLHFEIRPGGPNGAAIDPYPTISAHC